MTTKIVVKGDISGIQEFIFHVPSKKASRTLMSNSSIIQQLEEKYCGRVANTMSSCTYKQSGGGGFLVIGEGNEKTLSNLLKLQEEIDQEVLSENYRVRISSQRFETASSSWKKDWSELMKKNSESRYQYLKYGRDSEIEQFFLPQKVENSKSKIEKDNSDEKPSEKMIPFWTDELLREHEEYLENRFVTEQADELEEDREKKPKCRDVIDFDSFSEFSKKRTGTDFIGVLKMDVDNLGKLFESIHKEEEFKQISEAFSAFFKAPQKGSEGKECSVYSLWKKDSFESISGDRIPYNENVYAVFSGGDDCFFIGAWDAILKFSLALKKSFNQFKNELIHKKLYQETDKGNNCSISAGIVIVGPKESVIQIGEMAEHALEIAKSNSTKDSVGIMGERFSWEEYESCLKHSKQLSEFLRKDVIKKSFLEKVKKSAIGFERLQDRIRDNKELPLAKVWRLKYYLRDIACEKDRNEISAKIFDPYQTALLDAMTSRNATNPMRFPLAARFAEFYNRIDFINNIDKNGK